ncbi:MAG: hemerythrin domain-containing protein [Deltaproteobacteria bacterium]|nr:hemerythrin domain-containing protein [Deltaproteobacteria bacterium]
MHQAIDILMNEHSLILKVLASLQSFVDAAGPDDRESVLHYATFLRDFADKWHHGKEEDRLFVRMGEFGFPREFGPIAVMLADHVEGRAHTRALLEIGSGAGPLSDAELESVCDHAESYVQLLRAHIAKEDGILYPMALRAIPAAELDKLADDYAAFEREAMSEADHARVLAQADRLIARFPPSTDVDQHPMCVGCAG